MDFGGGKWHNWEMVPASLQGILWSKSVENLDLERDKNCIVHQILAYGRWEDLQWLFKTYDRSVIREVFVTSPQKDYVRPAFNFVKNFLP